MTCPEATDLCRQAVAALPASHPDRLWALIYLDAALSARPEQTADRADLSERVAILEEAVECSGDGRADDGTSRLGLAAALQARYEKTGEPADLTAAIGHIRQALDLVPGPIERAECQAALGGALRLRHERYGDRADLAEAVALSRQAAEAIPVGYANAGLVRSGLAAVLGTRKRDATAPDRPVSGLAGPTRAELIAAVAARIERFKRDEHGAVLDPARPVTPGARPNCLPRTKATTWTAGRPSAFSPGCAWSRCRRRSRTHGTRRSRSRCAGTCACSWLAWMSPRVFGPGCRRLPLTP